MVKRKSLNKLRSRYSSAILNSDTDIFGDGMYSLDNFV